MIIISILMAVAIPTFLSQKSTAQRSKATSNIKHIVNAIESCAANLTDGTYGNCANTAGGFSDLVDGEKSLTQFSLVGRGGANSPGEYAVRPIGTQGFSVATMIKDGDRFVGFAENHFETGEVFKICVGAASRAGATVSAVATTGTADPASRTCTTGSWG